MNQRNHYDVALAVSVLRDRVRRLSEEFDGDMRRIAWELENVSNALAGVEKCQCGLYHDEENVPESCRECAK